jgi:hypothetical protein
LDDAADRIGAIEADAGRAGSDVVDLIQRNRFQRRRAGGRRAHPQSVDKHQRLRSVCAAHEHTAGRSGPAVGDNLDSGLALEQGGKSPRTGAGNFLRADQRDVGEQIGQRLPRARRGNEQRRDGRLRERVSAVHEAKSQSDAAQRAAAGHEK